MAAWLVGGTAESSGVDKSKHIQRHGRHGARLFVGVAMLTSARLLMPRARLFPSRLIQVHEQACLIQRSSSGRGSAENRRDKNNRKSWTNVFIPRTNPWQDRWRWCEPSRHPVTNLDQNLTKLLRLSKDTGVINAIDTRLHRTHKTKKSGAHEERDPNSRLPLAGRCTAPASAG